MIQQALTLISLGLAIAKGDIVSPVEIARAVADLILWIVPVDDMKQYLDDAAKRRAELAADIAEAAKFGPRTPG